MVAWVVVTSVDCQIHSPCYRSVTVFTDPLLMNIHAQNHRGTPSFAYGNYPGTNQVTEMRQHFRPFQRYPFTDFQHTISTAPSFRFMNIQRVYP